MTQGFAPSQDERAWRFRVVWPLHLLRYGLIVTGVGSWLWKGQTGGIDLSVALLASLLLLVELPLHGPRPGRHGRLWAAVQLTAAVGAFGIEPTLPMALVLSAVVTGIAAVFSQRWAIGSLTVSVIASVIAAGASAESSPGSSPILAIVILNVLAFAVGRLTAMRIEELQAHETTVTELKEAEKRLSHMAATAKELAAAEEHRRLSEELHDTLGHALVGTLLQVQLAQKLVMEEPEAAAARLELVEKNVRETLQEVRHALRRGKRSREALPLHLALESLVAEFRAVGGPEVTLSFRPDGESVSDLGPEVKEALYRTAQEALTNSVRHGKARHVEIEAEAVGPRLYLWIRDDGVGAESYTPGMGLLGMVSRIQSVGGTLRFRSAPGQGFEIQIGVRRR